VQSDYDYQYRNHMRWDNQIGSTAQGSTNNSLYFTKGDYLAFREVSLSYLLPASLTSRMKLGEVEIFAGAYNLGYLKKYEGMFPEIYNGVDYGTTWKAGSPPPVGSVGECTVAELADGTLLLNMRTGDGFYRKQSLSNDGGLTWSAPAVAAAQLDAKCQGSILSIGSTLLLSHAAAATRTNMTIRRSADNGATWNGSHVVYTGNSGYSDMVELEGGKVAILYEGGKNRYTEGLDFKIIPISDIK